MAGFFDVVRDALRTQHYAYRTEKTYLHWIRQYVRFVRPQHPREAGVDGVKRFLTHLAVERAVILLLLQIVMDAEEKSELHEYLVAVGDRGAGRGVPPLRPMEVVSEGT